MKKYLAILLSALLLLSTAPMVAATYNDDEFDWGDLACLHNRLIEKAAVPSTCTVPGMAAYFVCADCHVLVGTKEPLPLAEHTYDHRCDTDCNVCGAVREVEPHTYAPEVVDATCTQAGKRVYTCTGCGDSYEEKIEAPGHAYDDRYDADCNVCGEVREVEPRPGDVNEDGSVDNRDLGLLQQYLNEWGNTIHLGAADVNNDGRVNNRDLGLLMRSINGWDVELV